jgi:hypothetical protein
MGVGKMRIIDIEQGSDQWHVERFRCVTGTKIQSAIGAKYSKAKGWTLGDKKIQQTLLLELVSEWQSELEIDDFCSETMERGNDLEPLSVVAASKKHGVDFVPCGMLQSDTLPNFKFSPDAVHYNKAGIIDGGYETKSKAGKKHIEYTINNEVPPEHLWQCLCPMIMDDCVKWWIFGHFDDRNHVNNLFTVGIKREDYEEQITEARELLIEFFSDVDATVEKMGGIYHG